MGRRPRRAARNYRGAGLRCRSVPKTVLFVVGGGGSFCRDEESGTRRINQERFDQINVANRETLAVVCPFCMTQMEDAVKSRALEEKMRVRGLAELIAEATGAMSGAGGGDAKVALRSSG
jgi:Fe-S oxidoreductase